MSGITQIKDKMWRLNNLYKIKDRLGNLIPFEPNEAQKHFLKNKHTFNIILKSRRLGWTTLEAIDSLDDCLFSADKIFDGIIIAHKEEDAKKIFSDKIVLAWENLDKLSRDRWHQEQDSAMSLKFGLFKEKSTTYNQIRVTTSGRSGTYSRVHVTELAYIDRKEPLKAKEIVSGTIPSVATGCRFDIESTPNGNTGFFYDIFTKAWLSRDRQLQPKEFKAHFYNWQWDQYEMDLITPNEIEGILSLIREDKEGLFFYESQKKNNLTDKELCYYYRQYLSLGNLDLLRQEYPTTIEEAFSSTTFNVFDSKYIIVQCNERLPEDKYEGFGIGVDVSTGESDDYSVISIISRRTGEQVKTIELKAGTNALALVLEKVWKEYNYGGILIERNGIGQALIDELKDRIALLGERKIATKGYTGTPRLGFFTTSDLKRDFLAEDCRNALRDEIVFISDEKTAIQLREFRYDEDRKKMSAPPGKNDDRAMAFMLAIQALKQVGDESAPSQVDFFDDGDNVITQRVGINALM